MKRWYGKPILLHLASRALQVWWQKIGAACLTILISASAAAEDCPGPNRQTIQLPPHYFTYESWVKPNGPAFTLGICIKNLSSEAMFSWGGTQLVSRSLRLNGRALVEFLFPINAFHWIGSELRYGFPKLDRALTVNVLAVDERRGPVSASSEVQAKVASWQRDLSNLPPKAVTKNSYTLVSEATLPIGNAHDKGSAMLRVRFDSFLPLKDRFAYHLSYSIVREIESDFPPDRDTFFEVSPAYLAAALKSANVTGGDPRIVTSNGRIALVGLAGSVGFQEFSVGTVVVHIGSLKIIRSGETIAAFPISVYVPASTANMPDPSGRRGALCDQFPGMC